MFYYEIRVTLFFVSQAEQKDQREAALFRIPQQIFFQACCGNRNKHEKVRFGLCRASLRFEMPGQFSRFIF